jgi:uncharacterized membrane protein
MGRLESFSDGVFGFAATLLVVDLAIHPPGRPLEQVLHAWPGYLAYVVGFLTIGAAWLAHTALTDRLAQADAILLRLNLLLLLVVAFLPFPTRLVAGALHHGGSERVFVTMYGLSLVAITSLSVGLAAYARRKRSRHARRAGVPRPPPMQVDQVIMQRVLVGRQRGWCKSRSRHDRRRELSWAAQRPSPIAKRRAPFPTTRRNQHI